MNVEIILFVSNLVVTLLAVVKIYLSIIERLKELEVKINFSIIERLKIVEKKFDALLNDYIKK